MEENDCQPISGFQVHTFSEKIMDSNVFFQVIRFDGGIYLWIGTSAGFGDLTLAMKNKYSAEPILTTLLGASDSQCNGIAQRLAKRTNKQVFVGGSLSYNQLMLPLIEKRIGEEIKAHPEIFIN